MSFNGGWGRIKIVEATPSRAQEILGGIKNALDRGEPLEKAKQTFINSGYTPQEVQEAAQLIGPRAKPLNPTQPALAQPATAPPAKKSSKKTIIILSVVGTVILILALVLGLFWDKIF